MKYLPLLLVAAGGALGALARYGLSGLVQGNRLDFPYGTLVVNLIGCFVMGLLIHWIDSHLINSEWRLLAGLGFLGAFTTFSTFSFEAVRLIQNRNLLGGVLYILYSVGGCLLLFVVAYLLARVIWPAPGR